MSACFGIKLAQSTLKFEASTNTDFLLQVTDRMSAQRLIMVAPKEWEAGKVHIKHLESREEEDLLVADLISASTRR